MLNDAPTRTRRPPQGRLEQRALVTTATRRNSSTFTPTYIFIGRLASFIEPDRLDGEIK